MVRTTIACSRCRKLKIKCIHEGVAPCRQCSKKGISISSSCVLSGPDLTSAKNHNTSVVRRRLTPSGESELISSMPVGIVLQACSTFARKFPELRFLHWPSFSTALRNTWKNNEETGESSKLRLLCASLMAACGPIHVPGQEISAVRLADYARENVCLIDIPDIMTVHTLIALSMFEWGAGNGYRAWMYTGIATRMMQSLMVLAPPQSLDSVGREVHSRSLWSCFIMDRLVFCGRPQPFTLSIYALDTHWPIGEQDFAFGQLSHDVHRTDEEHGPLEYMEGDIDHYYGILVRGFDIWARILKWIVSGGRRQAGMCLPENHPWAEGSPWKLLYRELQSWRDCQVGRLQYPATKVEACAALGHGEEFGYLNLIYYVSILFLMREYIPFLPHPDTEPSGPVDPPLLPLNGPDEWWHDRASELFSASVCIVKLLEDLEAAGSGLKTPFAGFCSFSAATMNLYVSNFPKMNLERSGDMQSTIDANLEFLDEFRKARPMGEGWWVTIQHCRALYEHASRDRQRFHGTTREDFAALEYSIHDSRGQPPTPEASSTGERMHQSDNGFHNASRHWHELPDTHGHIPDPTSQSTQNMGQIWPLWGQQQSIPFALEGVPFDFDIGMLQSEISYLS